MLRPAPLALLAIALAGCQRTESLSGSSEPFELGPVVEREHDALARELGLQRDASGRWPDLPLAPAEGASEPASAQEHERIGVLIALTASPSFDRVSFERESSAKQEVRALGVRACAPLALALADTRRPIEHRKATARLLGAAERPLSTSFLLTSLEHLAEPELRAVCALEFGEANEDWIAPRLVLALRDESDAEARALLAIALLLGCGNQSALDVAADLEFLRAGALGDLPGFAAGEAEVFRADWASGKLDEDLGLRQRSARYRCEVWRTIAQLGSSDARVSGDAEYVLSRLDLETALWLAQALHDADARVRTGAARTLERMGPRARAAGPELVLALDEPVLAAVAAAALGRVGHPGAEPALRRALGPGRPPELRIAAARSLGFVGLPASSDALRALLDVDEPLELRQAAGESLVYCGSAVEVLPALVGWLEAREVEAGTTEQALQWWFERRAEAGSPAAVELLSQWRAAEPLPGMPATAELAAGRRSRRAALVREHLAVLQRAR